MSHNCYFLSNFRNLLFLINNFFFFSFHFFSISKDALRQTLNLKPEKRKSRFPEALQSENASPERILSPYDDPPDSDPDICGPRVLVPLGVPVSISKNVLAERTATGVALFGPTKKKKTFPQAPPALQAGYAANFPPSDSRSSSQDEEELDDRHLGDGEKEQEEEEPISVRDAEEEEEEEPEEQTSESAGDSAFAEIEEPVRKKRRQKERSSQKNGKRKKLSTSGPRTGAKRRRAGIVASQKRSFPAGRQSYYLFFLKK